MNSGVSQGYVFGPTPFLIYINDLITNIKSTAGLFAEDTALFRRIRSQSDTHILQEDLRTLEQWKSDWKTFNVSKFLSRVSQRRKNSSTVTTPSMNKAWKKSPKQNTLACKSQRT